MKKRLVQIRLTEDQIAAAIATGDGNLSAGIRVAISAVQDCRTAIELVRDPVDRLALVQRALGIPGE
tara:strand:- start:230 stop:430 length:201 start_codon:yes stop_codon:yes gene_type:complete